MKTNSLRFLIFVLIILTVTSSGIYGQSRQKNTKSQKSRRSEKVADIQLFNGRNLSNWAFQLRDPVVDPATVFMVHDGVIHITGNPFGYMRTKDSYSEYKLHVEWRYPGEASNSGVFIHAQLPDTIWIRSFECQLAAGNAGDFICMNGTTMNEQKNNSRVVKKMAASSEKPAGEWNTMEVTCKSNTIEVTVNGILQNKATGISQSKGHICLQSEGKDIEFRNVFITKLPQAARK
ncbi:MAG: hypothetical protein H6Q24_46 [Bacteroidetes bacterium]|nr:hypothetical protein [Bacteroidota bacterium]